MKFAVQWLPDATAELASLWISSSDPDQVKRAAERLDKRLSRNPMGTGESRAGLRRITFEPPIAIYFETDPDAELVRIIRVWDCR
jgi:plasmid stabilization system protein ParE